MHAHVAQKRLCSCFNVVLSVCLSVLSKCPHVVQSPHCPYIRDQKFYRHGILPQTESLFTPEKACTVLPASQVLPAKGTHTRACYVLSHAKQMKEENRTNDI